MFCSSCGNPLTFGSHFCANCGAAVGVQPGGFQPGSFQPGGFQPAVPALIACFACGGTGKVHRSPMPHSAGCIFCQTCTGCSGKGVVPGNATRCPRRRGEGKYHDSPMPHSSPGCMFCTECSTCQSRGWLSA